MHYMTDPALISPTEYLKGGNNGEAGVSRNPQVQSAPYSYLLETDPGWMLIPPSWSGSVTDMQMNH